MLHDLAIPAHKHMKLFLFTPLDYENEHHPTHWNRNNGLLARQLSQDGHSVKYVSYGVAKDDQMDGISLAARHSDLIDEQWWRRHQPDFALIGGGTAAPMLPIYRAARRAGVKTIMTMDSGGAISPRHFTVRDFWYIVGNQYLEARVCFPSIRRVAKFSYYYLFWRQALAPLIEFCTETDYIRLVSPLVCRMVNSYS